jgi:hypothetical protein
LFRVLTNNPKAYKWWLDRAQSNVHIQWLEGNFHAVLIAARDLVHLGWRLLNHPLSSSIKPNQTPYKTLVLARGCELDHQSLAVIEAALATSLKLGDFPGSVPAILEDLQFIDLEMCKEIPLQ